MDKAKKLFEDLGNALECESGIFLGVSRTINLDTKEEKLERRCLVAGIDRENIPEWLRAVAKEFEERLEGTH